MDQEWIPQDGMVCTEHGPVNLWSPVASWLTIASKYELYIYINTYPIVRLVMKLICQRFWGPFCTAAGFGLGAVSFADSG
jgi:hypothetical protein